MKQVFLSFANQKGGCGKSSMTVLMASYLHYLTRLNVLVVDADYPQYSIYNLRKRDLDLIEKDSYFKRLAYSQLKTQEKTAFPILRSTPENAIGTLKEYLHSSKTIYNVVLFDLPGTVQSNGVLATLAGMDYVFVPLLGDRLVLESSFAFVKTLNDVFVKDEKMRVKHLYLFWNQVDARERNDLYDLYNRIIQQLHFNLLDNKILDTKRFRKEILADKRIVFRSTLFAPSRQFVKSSGLENLFSEIIKIVVR